MSPISSHCLGWVDYSHVHVAVLADFSLNIPQLGQADTPVDDAIAVRANPCQVSHLLGNRLIIRHVTCRRFRRAASDAVDFTGPTSLFVFCPASLNECGKITAQNQHRALAIAGWKPSLDPCAHCIFVGAKQTGDFLYGVAAVDLDEAMVGAAFFHDGLCQRCHTRPRRDTCAENVS